MIATCLFAKPGIYLTQAFDYQKLKTDAEKLAASDRLSGHKQNSNLSATLETKNKP